MRKKNYLKIYHHIQCLLQQHDSMTIEQIADYMNYNQHEIQTALKIGRRNFNPTKDKIESFVVAGNHGLSLARNTDNAIAYLLQHESTIKSYIRNIKALRYYLQENNKDDLLIAERKLKDMSEDCFDEEYNPWAVENYLIQGGIN